MSLQRNNIRYILLELGNVCNFKCPDCYFTKIIMPSKVKKSFLEYKKLPLIIKRYDNLSEVIISGNYSEPTLNPEFLKIVKYLKILKKKIYIYTNLETHDDDFWLKLSKILKPEDEITLSLFGLKENQEKYRINGNYEKLKNRYNLLKDKINITLQFIEFDYNKDDYVQLQKDFDKDIIKLHNNDIDAMFFKNFKIHNPVNVECKSLLTDSIEIDENGVEYPCHLARNYKDNFTISDEKLIFEADKDYCKMYCNTNKKHYHNPW